jgi:hypothetical protein
MSFVIKRVYHPYYNWEEVKYNMWGDVDDTAAYLQKAIEFTGDHKLYGSFMRRVANEWPISCENALTDLSLNRKAWIGHAATALAIGCPEDITRKAWGYLSDEQQFLANEEARRTIEEWENNYRKNKNLSANLGKTVLQRRRTR